jgi:hypothetical protein
MEIRIIGLIMSRYTITTTTIKPFSVKQVGDRLWGFISIYKDG